MRRKYGGKCLQFNYRDQANVLERVNIELSGLDNFDLARNNTDPREADASSFMRKRREGGWCGKSRGGEASDSRSLSTWPGHRIIESNRSRRDNEYL